MISELFEMVGASFILITGLMTLLWFVYFFQRNATIVDFGWVASFIIASLIYAFMGEGLLLRRLLITLMVLVWAGRLLWHLFDRYQKSKEDPRYTKMRQRMGGDSLGFKFFLMFIFQGVIALILTLPFLLSANNSNESWSSLEFWGFCIWLVGVMGEALADRQLSDFKKSHPGKICQKGFWNWSRHPNYFFEFIVWVGFALFAFPASFGFLALSAPLIIYYLLVYVSGIPLAEAESLETKGDLYREYQKTTSSFIPWFKS